MADIAITAANVLAAATARTKTGTAGEAITAGKVVALGTDGKYYLADNNSGTAALKVPVGVSLNGAANGQPVEICERGSVVIGGTLTAGVAYYLSDTPGGICPVADLASGESVSILGVASSASTLRLGIQASGVTL